jgi:hypothetical protein
MCIPGYKGTSLQSIVGKRESSYMWGLIFHTTVYKTLFFALFHTARIETPECSVYTRVGFQKVKESVLYIWCVYARGILSTEMRSARGWPRACSALINSFAQPLCAARAFDWRRVLIIHRRSHQWNNKSVGQLSCCAANTKAASSSPSVFAVRATMLSHAHYKMQKPTEMRFSFNSLPRKIQYISKTI